MGQNRPSLWVNKPALCATGGDGATIEAMNSKSFHRQMIAVCIAAYFWQTAVGMDRSIRLGAMFGPAVASGEWWRLLAAGFLHGSLMHLAFNMFALYSIGAILEPIMRETHKWGFQALYLGSLLGGSLGAWVLEPNVAAVGASGAVFGLLGAMVIIPAIRGFGWNGLGVLPWLGFNLFITFLVPGISVGGHVGGLLAGGGLAYVLEKSRTSKPGS